MGWSCGKTGSRLPPCPAPAPTSLKVERGRGTLGVSGEPQCRPFPPKQRSPLAWPLRRCQGRLGALQGARNREMWRSVDLKAWRQECRACRSRRGHKRTRGAGLSGPLQANTCRPGAWTSYGRKTGGTGTRKERFLSKERLEEHPRQGYSSSGKYTPPLTRRANVACFSFARTRGTRSPTPVPRRGLGPFPSFRYDVDLHSLAGVLVDPDLYAVGLVSFSDVIL